MKKEINKKGDLVLSLEKEGNTEDSDFTAELLERHGGNDIAQLCEILETTGWQPNGQLYYVAPEQIGALTDAPIVTDSLCIEDDGTVSALGNVWWYPDYAVSNFVEELKSKGSVVFTAAPVL